MTAVSLASARQDFQVMAQSVRTSTSQVLIFCQTVFVGVVVVSGSGVVGDVVVVVVVVVHVLI